MLLVSRILYFLSILGEECTNDCNLLGGAMWDYEERSSWNFIYLLWWTLCGPFVWSFRCLSCISRSAHSGVSVIHSAGVQIREQACSSHFRTFHLKLSFPSFCSLACLSSHSPSFCSTLPHSLYSFCTLLSLLPPPPLFFFVYALLLLVTLSPGLGGSDWVVSASLGNRKMKLPFL